MWYNGIPRAKPKEFHYTTRGYNPYTLENHGTADLYYDATTQTLGSVSLPQSLYFTMQLGCIFIHPRGYEISRVHGFCTGCFSFEVWLHHSTNIYIYTAIAPHYSLVWGSLRLAPTRNREMRNEKLEMRK